MSDSRLDYAIRNDQSRERLEALVEQLSPEQLGVMMPSGLTVAATFAHIAFWDKRMLAIFEVWGKTRAVRSITVDADRVNADQMEEWLAMPPEEATEFAIEMAEDLDHQIEGVPPRFADQIAEVMPRAVDRSLHRNEHLEEIEQILNLTGGE